jgi:hypothetical protein
MPKASRRRPQPMQPIIVEDGKARFQKNAIVRWLLDMSAAGQRVDLQGIALTPFTVEDREQFLQLIGYTVTGFGECSYVRKASVDKADRIAARLL